MWFIAPYRLLPRGSEPPAMACRHSHSFMRCGTFMDEHVGAAHQVHDDLPAVQGKNDDKGRIDGKPGDGKGAMVSRAPAFRHDRRHEDMTFPGLHRTLPPALPETPSAMPACPPTEERYSFMFPNDLFKMFRQHHFFPATASLPSTCSSLFPIFS